MSGTKIQKIQEINKSFTRLVTMLWSSMALLLLLAMVYLFQKGLLNFTNKENLDDVTGAHAELEKSDYQERIEKSLEIGDIKLAYQVYLYIEKKVRIVTIFAQNQDASNLQKTAQKIKENFTEALTLAKVQEGAKLLTEKVQRFNQTSVDNNWQSLRRSTGRLEGWISKHGILSPFLSKFLSQIKKEIDLMMKAVSDSALSVSDKAKIFKELESWSIEVEMLEKYEMSRKSLTMHLKTYSNQLKNYLLKTESEIHNLKIHARYLFLSLIALIFAVILFSFSAIFVLIKMNGSLQQSAQEKLEDHLKQLAEESLIGGQPLSTNEYSAGFIKQWNTLVDYVQKRMSYGLLFQSTIPFPAALLDHNLKIAWANQSFCSLWGLEAENIQSKFISWDYLARSTSFSDSAPIYDALQHNVAGIYHSSISTVDGTQNIPFEIYVSPVKVQERAHVMLYFYSLENQEDSIRSQVASIVDPIEKALVYLLEASDESTGEFEDLERNFQMGGISNIYVHLNQLKELHRGQVNELRESLLINDSKLRSMRQRLEQLVELNQELMKNISLHAKNFESLKRIIIGTIEDLESLLLSSGAQARDSRKKIELIERLKDYFHRRESLVADFQKIIEALLISKEQLRGNKNNIEIDNVKKLQNFEVMLSKTLLVGESNLSELIRKTNELNLAEIQNESDNAKEKLNRYETILQDKFSHLDQIQDELVSLAQDYMEKTKELGALAREQKGIVLEIFNEENNAQ